jgi:hypothetical protein
MAKLLAAIIVAVFMVLILGVGGEAVVREKRQVQITYEQITWDQFLQLICQNNPFASMMSICSTYTSTTTTSTSIAINMTTDYEYTSPQSSTTSSASELETTTTTESASALQRAHWCKFTNGTYIPLGYTFMRTECSLCQCTQSHAIGCTTLQCMPTYCIDNSAPSVREGQCCSQCAYDQTSTACIINGITFPDGTILKTTSDGTICWCELGNIECRKYSASLFSSLDIWGPGTAVYVIIIVICVMLIIGTLLCSAGAICFYYFYKRNQKTVQQAYEQYYNSAGWQPMGDEGVAVDGNGEEKKVEAEQNPFDNEYPAGYSEEYVSPPYALYNGSYINEQNEKDEKQI